MGNRTTGDSSRKEKEGKEMKYMKEIVIIFGITMIGELLNTFVPLPIPAGVYGLFILLIALCTGLVKLEDVETTGNLLLDVMPFMFVPAGVALIERAEELRQILVPFFAITFVSTLFVMTVTGKSVEFIRKREEKH